MEESSSSTWRPVKPPRNATSAKAAAAENPPPICNAIANVFALDEPAENSVDGILSFIGGFDARLENGFPFPCESTEEDNDCNALSMCVLFEMEGIEIADIAP